MIEFLLGAVIGVCGYYLVTKFLPVLKKDEDAVKTAVDVVTGKDTTPTA